MEAAVAGAALTGAMKALLPKLAALLGRNYDLPRAVEKDIASMRDEMSSMNALLTTLSRKEELDEQERGWRDKVRELSLDMEDCIDIYASEIARGDVKAGFKSRVKKLKAQRKIAKRIKDLKARSLDLSTFDTRYKLADLPQGPDLVTIDPRLSALYTEADKLVGIDGPKENLIGLLTKEEDAHQLKLVAVVGSGGIGKTALANQVYTKIKGQFYCTAFVSVSQKPNAVKILSDILLDVTGCKPESCDDERRLIDRLRKTLEDKRYLIVIDDIWSTEAWNIIKSCFVENNLDSRVIITSRIENVAEACCSHLHDHVYKMKPLNDLDSRRLFNRRIFYTEDACPDHLKNISDEILKKCAGMPLAILSVASLLASHHKELESWETVLNGLIYHLERNPDMKWMRHVLNLGYNDLSLDLKTCLLYLGIFPEDSEIMKRGLISAWIAEGFVTEKYTYGPEEIAQSYFNELINRNMIQIADSDECGEVVSCRVHDLMLDFIISKCTQENFITMINGQHSAKGSLEARRLSLSLTNSESNMGLGNMPLTQARSFYFWGPAKLMPSLSKFLLLRVLYLDLYDSRNVQCDLSSIGSLFNLGYLRTRGIKYDQASIRLQKLQRLKTLEIVGDYNFFKLDVSLLPSTLLHLIAPATVKVTGDIGRMSGLRTLAYLNEEDEESVKGLGDLSNLKELKLSSCIWRVDPLHSSLISSLCRLSSLQSLVIHGFSNLGSGCLTGWSTPLRHLRRLHALDSPLSGAMDWLAQLTTLTSLEVTVESMPRDGADILAKLTLLLHLRLHIKNRAPEEEGVVIRAGAAFPDLKSFWFRCRVPCLVFEAGAMPRVESLTLECHRQAVWHADGVLHGIEHLGSLMACKVVIERCNFSSNNGARSRRCFIFSDPRGFVSQAKECIDYSAPPHVDKQTLETAVRKAIHKHPASPSMIIQYTCTRS